MNIAKTTLIGLFGLTTALYMWAGDAGEPSLLQIQKILAEKKFVDFTHAFAPGIPHWHGFPDEKRSTVYWYEKRRGMMGAGFFAETFTHVGQWGTHVDPPAHFVRSRPSS